MHAFAEVVSNLVRIFARHGFIIKDIQKTVVIVEFKHVRAVFFDRENNPIPSFFRFYALGIGF
jgi:hypothetical protein